MSSVLRAVGRTAYSEHVMVYSLLSYIVYYRAPSLSHSMIISHWIEEIQFGYSLSSSSSFFFLRATHSTRVIQSSLSCNLLVNNIFGVCMPCVDRCVSSRYHTIRYTQARTQRQHSHRKLYVLVGQFMYFRAYIEWIGVWTCLYVYAVRCGHKQIKYKWKNNNSNGQNMSTRSDAEASTGKAKAKAKKKLSACIFSSQPQTNERTHLLAQRTTQTTINIKMK